MINLIKADIKRFWWVWIIITTAILVDIRIGIFNYHSTVQLTLQVIQDGKFRDMLHIQNLLHNLNYPYYMEFTVLQNAVLFLSIQSLLLGSILMGREMELNTVPFLFSFPIFRCQLLMAKYLTGIICLFSSLAIICLSVYMFSRHIGVAFSAGNLLLMMMLLFLQFLTMFSYAFLLSILSRKQLVSLCISGLISLALVLNPLRPKVGYLNTGLIFANGTIPWSIVLLMIATVLVCLAMSFVVFQRMEVENDIY